MSTDERRAEWPGAGVVLCDTLLLIQHDGWRPTLGRCHQRPGHDGDHTIGSTISSGLRSVSGVAEAFLRTIEDRRQI